MGLSLRLCTRGGGVRRKKTKSQVIHSFWIELVSVLHSLFFLKKFFSKSYLKICASFPLILPQQSQGKLLYQLQNFKIDL